MQQAQNYLARDLEKSQAVMKYGRGAKVFDQDGGSYTDYCLSHGALIAGHAHRNVILAIKRSVNRGISFDTVTKAEIDLARHIVNSVPSIERVCFMENAVQAIIESVKTARAFTSREKVIVIEGYLQNDTLETLYEKTDIIRLTFNDINSFAKAVAENKNGIACVVAPPIKIVKGMTLPQSDYLKKLRKITNQYGIVLIFDETITGFRTSRDCVQGDFDVIPDMTCLGGIIGGGFPLGAFGGKRGIMDVSSCQRSMRQLASSFGNRVIMRAGLAQLKLLGKDFYSTLNTRCENFVNQINAFFRKEGMAVYIASYKSMFSIHFTRDDDHSCCRDQNEADNQKYGDLHRYLLDNNISGPPSGRGVYFISGMHSQKDLNQLTEVLKEYFQQAETG